MKGTRRAQEHSLGGWSGKTILEKMKTMKIIKNGWCVPGPAGVARPTEAGRPVFSCVMRWPWWPAASKSGFLAGRPPRAWAGRPKSRNAKMKKMKYIKNE